MPTLDEGVVSRRSINLLHCLASCLRLPEVCLRSTYVSSTDESYAPSDLDNIRNVNN